MPWASATDQEAGFVVAGVKGQGRDRAKVFIVVSLTLTIAEAAMRLGTNPMNFWGAHPSRRVPRTPPLWAVRQ